MMFSPPGSFQWCAALLWLCAGGASLWGAESPEGAAFFESRIRPALVEHCYKCHAADSEKIKGGLRLDTREGTLKGGESGPALVPGKPDESLLIKAVRRLDKDLAMPPKKELGESIVNDFVAWVKMGAPDPRTESTAPVAVGEAPVKKRIDYEAERQKWAFHAPQPPAIPGVKNAAWVRNPIDAFVLSKMEAAGVAPAPPADKLTLIRRMTYDLAGLPPAPGDVAAFLADDSPEATDRVIERLLACPQYGEHWGRHWLDVARYADSLDARGTGNVGDILDAWRYRDWVVKAFNDDLPYDQFVTRQVAGDILAARDGDLSKTVATGLYAIGNWGNGDADKEKLYTDIVDDQVDVTARAFLGLTLACARCHDHKFDPLTAADYYSMAGIFFSSHILDKFANKAAGESMMRISLLTPEAKLEREKVVARLGAIDAKLSGGLRPLTEKTAEVAGKPGLSGWHPKKADNPSLVINSTAADLAFSTIKLPARAVAVHPGPKETVTVAWQSPIEGRVKVNIKLRDVDPNCGDGILWAVRLGANDLGSGAMANGAGAEFSKEGLEVKTGELLQVLIRPGGEYTCDSTRVEFSVAQEGGPTWDFAEALMKEDATPKGADGVWFICAGEGDRFNENVGGKAGLEAERKTLESQLAAQATFCQGMQEGGIPGSPYAGFHEARIHVRGRYDRLGEMSPRGFPVLLSAEKKDEPIGGESSGRLELARWLSAPKNPLTARVMVNRIWLAHFGEGIVRTPNNFGKLGTPPTHPELLDWLALEFVKSGWSVKAIQRLILQSATYRQAAQNPGATAVDPQNLLFAHANRRRLSAEELRDSLLVAAGKLDLSQGGPSVRDLASLRRTLYITTIRSERATFQMLFDGADPNGIVEKRTEATVAPQALWLLNSPFAMAQARALAARVEAEAPAANDREERVSWVYRRLFFREPTARESEVAAGLIERLGVEAFCQVLLCSNEFAYVD